MKISFNGLRLLTPLLILGLALVACTKSGKSRPVDALEARGLLQNRLAVLLDVREQDEVRAEGLAEGAVWMPTSKIEANDPAWQDFLKSLDRDKMVVVYCKSGGRAEKAIAKLVEKGFQAGNMGGLSDWKAKNLPVIPCPSC